MGEETIPVHNKSEMSPQEDGTKVLLKNDGPVALVEEAKYVSNPNGDAKIDVQLPPAFSGLTKEELMKYSKDPFWVRLRWFLFIVFWAGWLAMLIMAIIIIIQAPGCKPPPELLWIEEQPLLEVDTNNLPSYEELNSKFDDIGISTVYMPDLISPSDFEDMNYEATSLIDALVKSEKKVVTDLPSIDPNNPFYANATSLNLFRNGSWNYDSEELPKAIFKEVVKLWIPRGVTGFLMKNIDSSKKQKFKNSLNVLADEEQGAIGGNIVETENEFNTPSMFKSFLEEYAENWSFFKFNPSVAVGSSVSEESLRLVTMGLFTAPGTPLLQKYESIDNSTAKLIKTLSKMKSLGGIKFGSTNFVNSTDNVVAFTRVYKGTPAYAVALNFNDSNTTVSFKDTANVGKSGTIELYSKKDQNLYLTKDKMDLSSVFLDAHEGIILQFVAKF